MDYKETEGNDGESDYAFKIVERSGGEQEKWDNYRRLKNLTKRKIKPAEASYYKNLIESAQGPKELWLSLNSVLGNGKNISSARRSVILEPKAVASKINKFSATTGCRIAKKLRPVPRDAWKKYESVIQGDGEDQCVRSKAVSKILHSLRVINAAGLDKVPVRFLRDAEVELSPSTTYLININRSQMVLSLPCGRSLV